jgi:hypothetical protein
MYYFITLHGPWDAFNNYFMQILEKCEKCVAVQVHYFKEK